MVPVRMGDEQRDAEWLVFEFREQRLAKQSQTGAGIQNDNVFPGANFHAGGISSVTHGTTAGRGYGAADSPKLDGGTTFDGKNLAHALTNTNSNLRESAEHGISGLRIKHEY